MPNTLTTHQAAELVGCTPQAIARHCKSGRLPARKKDGDWLIGRGALRRFRLGRPGRPKKRPA